jgi:hypothetical protein
MLMVIYCFSIHSLQIKLIEVNVNPALSTNCETLRQVVPGVVREALCMFVW